MGSGEERHYFLFHERNPELPIEVVITRLPPLFEADKNWHRHNYVEEFSVPLTGEIEICEKKEGKRENKKRFSNAILRNDEWVVGINCESAKKTTLQIDSSSGNRREVKISFDPKFTEGKDWHKVGNPTGEMITMITIKKVPKNILKKDPFIFKVDRTPALDER